MAVCLLLLFYRILKEILKTKNEPGQEGRKDLLEVENTVHLILKRNRKN